MKIGTKLFYLALTFVLAISSCTKLNSGDSFNQLVNGVEYNFEVIVSKMTFVRISPVQGPSVVTGNIVIPAFGEYEGIKYTVTQIKENAFTNYSGITSVKLPATLSQIEKQAFAGCTSLREINTPQTLSVIGDYAFDGCISLEEFSLDASISELGEGAFRNCSSLEEIEFTPTFSAIPDYLCSGCSSIDEISLPSTIQTVGNSAFEGCSNVQEISMDRSVKSLGIKAFSSCTSVQNITCLTATPPSCSADTFEFINPSIPVTVPNAHIDDYINSTGWDVFNNYVGTYQ